MAVEPPAKADAEMVAASEQAPDALRPEWRVPCPWDPNVWWSRAEASEFLTPAKRKGNYCAEDYK